MNKKRHNYKAACYLAGLLSISLITSAFGTASYASYDSIYEQIDPVSGESQIPELLFSETAADTLDVLSDPAPESECSVAPAETAALIDDLSAETIAYSEEEIAENAPAASQGAETEGEAVKESAREEETESGSESETAAEPGTEPVSEAENGCESEAGNEAEAESSSEPISEAESGCESDTENESEMENESKSETEFESEFESETEDASAEESAEEVLLMTEFFSDACCIGQTAVYRNASDASELIAVLPADSKVVIMKDVTLSSGSEYYQIRFEYGDSAAVGYVHADCLSVCPSVSASYDIDAFPESYRAALTALLEAHPDWNFVPLYTGLDWNEAVTGEMFVPYNNLASYTYLPSAFWSKEQLGVDASGRVYNYNRATGVFYQWQPGWYAVSRAGLAYFMDPRNFLTENNIFMFETMYYGGQTEEMVEGVLSGTFMSHTFITDNTLSEPITMTYAQIFTWIGQEYNINPLILAARVRQEQGLGNSPLISGTYPGFEGLYNYFNMGATGSTTPEIIQNGLLEARTGSTMILPNGESYSGSWNSRLKALVGGALKMASVYLDHCQDTLYLQKFDVDSTYNSTYWHQYMQNVSAPYSESLSTYRAYQSYDILNGSFTFKIPVYENMPASPVPYPGQNSNNTALSSVMVDQDELFTGDTSQSIYRLTVEASRKQVTITVLTADVTSIVSGNGTYALAHGENTFTLDVTAESGKVQTYTLVITREPSPAPVIDDVSITELTSDGYLVTVSYQEDQEVSYVYMPTWTSKNGQDDLIWHLAETTAASSSYYVSVKDHKGESGLYYTHIYVTNTSGLTTTICKEITVPSARKTIAPVKNLKAVQAGGRSITLSWTASSDKVTGYVIFRKTASDPSFTSIGKVSGTSFTDTGAVLDAYNFYRVYPYIQNEDGSITYGTSDRYVFQKPSGRLAALTGLKASSLKTGVKLSWNAVSGAEGYLIYGIRAGSTYGYIGYVTDALTFIDQKASADAYNFYWVFPFYRLDSGKMVPGGCTKYTYGRALK